MSFHSLRKAAVLGLLAIGISAFDPNILPTGVKCVDPSGFQQCFTDSEDTLVSCGDFCTKQTQRNYNDCILSCSRAQISTNLGCWIQSCWNQVYTCEYQLTAIQYLKDWDLVQGHPDNFIPFYPAPDEAGGACSCNLGYIYGNSSYSNFNNVCIDVAATGDQKMSDDCGCCRSSLELSNTITACPNSDLTNIADINQLISNTQELVSDSIDQCAVLDNTPSLCTDEYNFPYANNIVHNPFNLPPAGKEPVSNLEGNAFTERGDALFTLSLKGHTSVITLAEFNTPADAVTTGITAGGNALLGTGTLTEDGGSVGATRMGTGARGSATGAGGSTGAAGRIGSSKAALGSLVAALVLLNML